MARRVYSNVATDTTLNGSINASVLSLTVADATGYPSSGAFTIVIDPGQGTEEVVLIDSRSGTTFTVNTSGRGFDGTSASSHTSGASVKLVAIAADFEDAAAHRWDTPAAAGDQDTATGIHHTLESTASNYSASAPGDAKSAGTSAKAASADHVHGRESFATPSIVLGSAAAAGSASTPIRSDSTIAAFDATAPTTSAVGDSPAAGSAAKAARRDHAHGREGFATPGNSAVGDSAGAGAASTVSRSDHQHGRESFATPNLTLGTAAAAGAATTPIRSDATIAAFDATVPVSQAIGDAAAAGSAGVAARRDHKHGMPASITTANLATGDATKGTDGGEVTADESTSSQTYTDLSTAGPSVTLTTGTKALILVECQSDNATNSARMSYAISGATTQSPADGDGTFVNATAGKVAVTRWTLHTGLTAGSNTFTAKYRVGAGGASTGSFAARRIIVIPLD